MEVPNHLHIVWLLTFGFTFASLFGFLSHKMHLSPIVGYLFAGYLIGPFSPGFVADLQVAEQLAEIGVILMMFGVGLHFKWQELYSVKGIAVPGACFQIFLAVLFSLSLLYYLGWSIEGGVIMGLAIGVSSTVLIVRNLTESNFLKRKEGHVIVGWTIVEDIITVLVLLLLPIVAVVYEGDSLNKWAIFETVAKVLLNFLLMAALILTLGKWIVSKILNAIVPMQQEELFTIVILAIIFLTAAGTSFLFGTSIALGAFAAGMVIGQTVSRQKALAHALPLKDTFAVIFFLAVGMLFNPIAIYNSLGIFFAILGVIFIVKSTAAFLITILLRYPIKTAFFIAVSVAQIGELSFILAEEATKLKILPDKGYDIIVACAILSIILNPILFKQMTKQFK